MMKYETFTEHEQMLAKAYAQADLLSEFRQRAEHERYMAESIANHRRALQHNELANLLDSISEAIIGGEF